MPEPRRRTAYYARRDLVELPQRWKTILSRAAFPLLAGLSREHSLRLGLVPLDDERVVAALRLARGRLLDIGCGSNLLVRSYGNGIGVDVVPWEGCDIVIEDAARLPFGAREFDTVAYLASLNHIHNRASSLKEAHRVLRDDGQLLVTMIGPRLGAFAHRIRRSNDPDHQHREIDEESEYLGMSADQIAAALSDGGFEIVERRRFVFGLNSIYVARKSARPEKPSG